MLKPRQVGEMIEPAASIVPTRFSPISQIASADAPNS